MRTQTDPLERRDWEKLYGDAPDCIHAAADNAFETIRRRQKRRRGIVALAACAACLAVLAVGTLALRPMPDRISDPLAQAVILRDDSTVYTSRADAHFHVDSECPSHSVALPLITAREFHKTPCPQCCIKVVFADE